METLAVLWGPLHATSPALVRSESWAPSHFRGCYAIGKAGGLLGALRKGNPGERASNRSPRTELRRMVRGSLRAIHAWKGHDSAPKPAHRAGSWTLAATLPGNGATRAPLWHGSGLTNRTPPFLGMNCGRPVARGACVELVSSWPRCGNHQARSRYNDSPGGEAIQFSKAFPWAGTSVPRVGKHKACRRRRSLRILARLLDRVWGAAWESVVRSVGGGRVSDAADPGATQFKSWTPPEGPVGFRASSVREGRGQTAFPCHPSIRGASTPMPLRLRRGESSLALGRSSPTLEL